MCKNTRTKETNKNYLKCAIFCVAKLTVKFLRRVLNLTFYEILFILATVFFYVAFVIFSVSDDDSILYDRSELTAEDTKNVEISSEHPIIVWWTETGDNYTLTVTCPNQIKCKIFNRRLSNTVGAYLFYGSALNFNNLPLPRDKEVIWGLFHEESPRNVQELMHEETLRLFNFSSTFSRHSDVPFPLQYIESLETVTSREYFVETAVKNSLLNEIAPVMYLQSDCETSTERDAYVNKLMEYIEIDSYGACLKNKQMPRKFRQDYLNNLDDDELLRFVARYKFVITIENGVCDDYVTEKFWRAIKVGSVPIYFGSPLIRDWLPNSQSAILVEDFPTPKILTEYIMKIMRNDNLYEIHLEHKTKGIIRNIGLINELKARPYQTDISETYNTFICFICKNLHHKSENNVMKKSHYNCPTPLSALTLQVNELNGFVNSWEIYKREVENIYHRVFNT